MLRRRSVDERKLELLLETLRDKNLCTGEQKKKDEKSDFRIFLVDLISNIVIRLRFFSTSAKSSSVTGPESLTISNALP